MIKILFAIIFTIIIISFSFVLIIDAIKVMKKRKSIKTNKDTIKKILEESNFTANQLGIIKRSINSYSYQLDYNQLSLILDPKVPYVNMLEITYMFTTNHLTIEKVLEILEEVPDGIYGKSDDIELAKNKYLIHKEIKFLK